MQVQSNTDDRLLEELILSCVPWVERLARKHARKTFRIEYDDLVQIGMTEVCKEASRATTKEDAVPYLCKAAEHAMFEELTKVHHRRISAVSLDAPLSSDESFSLLDLVASSDFVSSSSPDSNRVCAVRKAVDHLAPRRRLTMLHYCGFEGYGKHTDREASEVLKTTESNIRATARQVRSALRRNVELCEVVGVEVMQ